MSRVSALPFCFAPGSAQIYQPLPMEYIRLGSFTSPPETRKERTDDGGLLDSLRSQYISIYPFTIYHASNKSTRRYTLYVASESIRKRWYSAFVDAIGVHKVRQDANMVCEAYLPAVLIFDQP